MDMMLPDMNSQEGCRRCGEPGHWAKECLNAPMAGGAMAVTYVPPPPPETENEIFEQVCLSFFVEVFKNC